MKTRLITFVFVLCVAFQAQAQDMLLGAEANHSTIGFYVPIAGGITKVSGKFTQFLATMSFVQGNPAKSSMEATIYTKSINTGIENRDKHLRSRDFFYASKHYQIKYKSTKISKSGKNYKVDGEMTIRGVTKPIRMEMIPMGQMGEGIYGFRFTGTINRQDFGVSGNFNHPTIEKFIGDEIELDIHIWTRAVKTD